MRFSLIVPTLGRTAEAEKLFASLVDQKRSDLELIVVDQNDDDRMLPLLQNLPESITVLHVRQNEKNVSAARNAGMDAASGAIIAFPDDDCWYPSGLLAQVDLWFRENPEYSVLATGALDDAGIPSGNRWVQNACDIGPVNVLRTTFCSSLFVSAPVSSRTVRFDPALNRGEETDFILRLLDTGCEDVLTGSFHVHHPRRDMLSGTVSRSRAVSYGAGMGRLVRRHSLILLWLGLLTYDVCPRDLGISQGSIRGRRLLLRPCRRALPWFYSA